MSSLTFGERFVRSAWRVMPQRAVSEIIGWGARRTLPSAVRASFLKSFAGRYGIDLSEAEKPLAQYTGVQDLFTRRLRPGARTIDLAPGIVVSPADGTIVDAGLVTSGRLLEAKGTPFSLDELLADEEPARRLDGGAYLVTYLSPRDYHRVHFPVAGRVVGWNYIPGTLFPVNDRSVRREPGLFAKNERFVTVLDSEVGLCAVVMVAAVGVGHITASYDPEVTTHANGFGNGGTRHKRFDSPIAVQRGDELGTFNLGSTTIVVFEPGRVILDGVSVGASSRVGAALGRDATQA